MSEVEVDLDDFPVPFKHPFHDDDADIVIRSGDIKFAAHRVILSKASSVFSDMFKLPQGERDIFDKVPIVDITESSEIVCLMLSYCYPVDEPELKTLDMTVRLLEAMRKYAMDAPMKRVAKVLTGFARDQPLRVFATARQFGLQETSRVAARHTLGKSLWSLVFEPDEAPEFDFMTVSDLRKLHKYHKECGEVAAATLDDMGWVWDGDYCFLRCKKCEGYHKSFRFKNGAYTFTPRQWWMDYVEETQAALKLRPRDSVAPRPSFFRDSEAMKEAKDCGLCGVHGIADLLKFSNVLSARITTVTNEVEIEL